jgi:hypothetical protein
MVKGVLFAVILYFISLLSCDVEGFVVHRMISIGKGALWSRQLNYYNRKLFASEISPYPDNCQHHPDQSPSVSYSTLSEPFFITTAKGRAGSNVGLSSGGLLESIRKCLRENDSLKGRIDLCNQILGFVDDEKRKLLTLIEDFPASGTSSELSRSPSVPSHETGDLELPVHLPFDLSQHQPHQHNNDHHREAAARLLSKSVRESLDHSTTAEYQQIRRKMNHLEDHHTLSTNPASSHAIRAHDSLEEGPPPVAAIDSESQPHSNLRNASPVSSTPSVPPDITRVSVSATPSISLPITSPSSSVKDTESYYKENYSGTQVDMNQVVKRSRINWNQLRNSGSSTYEKAQRSQYEPVSSTLPLSSRQQLFPIEKNHKDINDASGDVRDTRNYSNSNSVFDEIPPLFNSDGGLGALFSLIERS